MGDVIHCTFTPKVTDGARARIRARRERLLLAAGLHIIDQACDDLVMDHADIVDTRPEAMRNLAEPFYHPREV